MRSKCEVFFKEFDFKSATIRSAKTQYEISTLSLIRIRDFILNKKDTSKGVYKIGGYSVYDLKVQFKTALLHKDLKCKAPLIEPNLRRNLGKWST